MDPAKLHERNERQYRWIERLQARVAKLEAIMQRAGLPIPDEPAQVAPVAETFAIAEINEAEAAPVKPKFDRNAYQREAQRKRRAAIKAKAADPKDQS